MSRARWSWVPRRLLELAVLLIIVGLYLVVLSRGLIVTGRIL